MSDAVKDLRDCATYLKSWQPSKQFVYTESGEDHHYILACHVGAAAIEALRDLMPLLAECDCIYSDRDTPPCPCRAARAVLERSAHQAEVKQ
jgi:hypothetical protein